jgi:type II secretory pathway pseudopilin PulG
MKLAAILIVTLMLAIGSLVLLAWIGAQDSRTAKEHRLRLIAQVLSIAVPIALIWLVSTCLFLIPDIHQTCANPNVMYPAKPAG